MTDVVGVSLLGAYEPNGRLMQIRHQRDDGTWSEWWATKLYTTPKRAQAQFRARLRAIERINPLMTNEFQGEWHVRTVQIACEVDPPRTRIQTEMRLI